MTSTLPVVLLCLVSFPPSSILRSQAFPCAVYPSLDTTFSPIMIHCLIVCPAHTHVLVQHTYTHTTHHTYIHTCICKHIYVYTLHNMHICIHQTHIRIPAHTYTHMHTYTQETVNTSSHSTHKTYTTHITHTPHNPYTHTNMQV